MSNYTSVLTMLLRLRQACDHPSLVASSFTQATNDDADGLADLLGGLGVDDEKKCEICFRIIDRGHTHCAECEKIVKQNTAPSSAKIRKMLELIKEVLQRGEKVIVFSQFTSFFNIIEPFLVVDDIKFARCKSTSGRQS